MPFASIADANVQQELLAGFGSGNEILSGDGLWLDPAEPTVAVSGFGPAPAKGRIRSTSVDLYFQQDGSVIAEAYRLIDKPGEKLDLRIHSATLPLPRAPPCGRTPERFDEPVTIIRE